MSIQELIEALDQRYGNPYATDCALIQESIKALREQQAEIEALKKQLAFMEGEYPEPTIMAKMMEVDLVRQQQAEIEYWKEMFDKAMKAQEK